MKIITAKTAGFCYGVNRAVQTAENLLDEGKKLCTLGSIVHNSDVIESLNKRGCRVVKEPNEAKPGETVLIRAHGVPASIYSDVEKLGLCCVDATCPHVKRIHKLVMQAGERGETVLVAGAPNHPEVIGILGHCTTPAYAFDTEEALENLIKKLDLAQGKSFTVVCQTTLNSFFWEKCVNLIKKVCTNAKIFATMCDTTLLRQQEAAALSKECSHMIVIGSRDSSNTTKLFEICSASSCAMLVQNASSFTEEMLCELSKADKIGITAGASTPAAIIKEVCKLMTEKFIGDENFAALLEESFKNSNTNGKVVTGTVVGIAPGEIYVDVGRKQSGIVQLEELTDNPNLSTSDCVKIGDELELMILRTNDQEGYIYLSKKILDSSRAWDEIKAAAPKIVNRSRRRDRDEEDYRTAEESENENAGVPTQEVIEQEIAETVVFSGVVTEVVNGGVIVSYKGVKVFVPARQATLSASESLEGLLKKEVKFVVLEVNPGRHRAVGSISRVLREERKAKEQEFWQTIDVDQVFKGTVKSLTNYGAFVDLGAVDGMVHISELSWNRIKHPSEVVNVGDVVEVFVKKVDKEKKKISLGYKKQEDNPWEILRVKYPVGTVIEGVVVSTPTFGAFVRIIPGIDGLVHISQLSTTRVAAPTDVVKEGDVVKAEITEIDFDRKRVSLSIKKLLMPEEPAVEAEVEETPAE